MKRVFILLFVFATCVANAQVVFNQSFQHKSTYGGRVESLFPVDNDDFAILTGVVECDKNSAEILDAVNSWFGRECFKYKLDVKNDEKFISGRQLIFRAEMPVSRKLLFDGGTPAAFTGVSLDWEVSESDVTFVCKIDIKDKKFRYSFSQIVSDRWMLRGDAETEGPINDIHSQRINCLKIKMNNAKDGSKRKKELTAMIEREKFIYAKEYEQMKQLEQDLINCVKNDVDNEDFNF